MLVKFFFLYMLPVFLFPVNKDKDYHKKLSSKWMDFTVQLYAVQTVIIFQCESPRRCRRKSFTVRLHLRL